MEHSFSSRMTHGVNAVESEVPMPQFTATLRNFCFPVWRDSPRQLVCSWCCIVWLLHLNVHIAFCLLLYSVCPYWAIKWTLICMLYVGYSQIIIYVAIKSCQKYIPSSSLSTDYLLSYCLLALFSFDVLDSYSVVLMLVCSNFVRLNFVERVKMQIWGKPIFLSWTLYIK